jgi:hypothetical protein
MVGRLRAVAGVMDKLKGRTGGDQKSPARRVWPIQRATKLRG